MVFVLPTVGDQLGSGLDKLIAGVNHAINPDYGFQEAMKHQLATNPQLVKSLADLEVQAPGTLKGLGFGPLTSLLQAVPESPEGTFNRTSAGDIVAGKQAGLAADTAGAKLNANLHGKVLAALADPENPGLAKDYIQRVMSGENVAEYNTTVARGKEAAATAAFKEAELPGLLEQVKSKQAQLEKFTADLPELQKTDAVDLVNDVMAGRKTPVDLAEYAMREGGHQALTIATSIAEMKYRAAEAKANRLLAQKLDPTERANIQTAAALARQSRIGDVGTWRTVMEDQTTVNALRAKDPKTLTPDEKDIVKAAGFADERQAMDQQRQNMNDQLLKNRAANEKRQAYFTAQNAVKNATTREGLAAGLSQMNAVIGPDGYEVRYGSPPDIGKVDKLHRQRGGFFSNDWFTPGNQPYIVDTNNKRVDPEEPFADKSYQQQVAVGRAYTQIKGAKDSAAELAGLQKANPALYDAVIKRYPDLVKP